MHPEIDHFVASVKEAMPKYFNGTNVLEVGSQDINGSVRKHFTNCKYLGLDLGEAPGVDLVEDIIDFSRPEEYDVVISSEMLEHCITWEGALRQMYSNLKSGGILIITCAGPTRQEHGTRRTSPADSQFTLDHYRNISIEDLRSILPPKFFKDQSLGLYRGAADLYFYGVKK
jgi:SAM-dependent methyltransferase